MTTKKKTFFTTIASAVDVLGKSLLEWIGAPGGLATLDNSSNLEQPAKKIATSRTIDGVAFDGSANIHHFGVCSTAAETTSKVVAIPGFVLAAGAVATVKFTYTNTANAPTLNVNSTGAKTILYNGTPLSTYVLRILSAGNPIELLYDGSNYHVKNPVTAGSIDAGIISQYHLGNNSVTNDKLDSSLQKSIKSVKNSTLVCTGVGYGYSSTDYSGNVYGGTPSEGDLIVGNIDHGVSHTEYAPAILRYNGEVFEVLLYGSECVGRFVFVADAETGYMLPYYITSTAIVNKAPLWPYAITNDLLATESVTGNKIANNTILPSHFDDNLFDALNPWYLNQVNGPVYLKISALQMSTPTDDAWVSYPTTLAVWNAVKNAVTNGIPVYLVDLYPLVTNTSKYLCTVMYYQNHGREGVGSFLFQYNRSSTTINGFKLNRSGSTFSCVSF